MKVREIMTSNVATATPDNSLEEVAIMMRDEDTGAIPVLDGDELTGIITDRDIVIRALAEGKDAVETRVEDILTDNLETIEPDSEVDEAADLMAQRQIRRLPVVENGKLLGVVSLGDIAVKHQANMAARALGSVSEGVRTSSGRKQPAGSSRPGKNSEFGRTAVGATGTPRANPRQNGRNSGRNTDRNPSREMPRTAVGSARGKTGAAKQQMRGGTRRKTA